VIILVSIAVGVVLRVGGLSSSEPENRV